MDHAITIRDILYVSGGLVALILMTAAVAVGISEDMLGVILHRYIRSGERVYLRSGDKPGETSATVTIEGWGKYAVVRLSDGPGAIRRDCIRKDAAGKWCYRYEN